MPYTFYQTGVFLNSIIPYITNFGVKLLGAVIVLIVGIKISKWISRRIERSNGMNRFDAGVKKFTANAVKIAFYAVTIISAAGIIGIPSASFIAVLGSAGVAIGLALQGSLSNIASGILILVNKPFRAGDFIEAGDISGTVKEIGFFSTTIVTPDNKVISYPNGTLSSACITNYSAMQNRRVDLTFSAGYDSDIDRVKEILLKAAYDNPLVISEPAPPFAAMSEQGASALDFVLRVWCKSDDYWAVRFGLNEAVKRAFDENGIEIPYNKLDVNICGNN